MSHAEFLIYKVDHAQFVSYTIYFIHTLLHGLKLFQFIALGLGLPYRSRIRQPRTRWKSKERGEREQSKQPKTTPLRSLRAAAVRATMLLDRWSRVHLCHLTQDKRQQMRERVRRLPRKSRAAQVMTRKGRPAALRRPRRWLEKASSALGDRCSAGAKKPSSTRKTMRRHREQEECDRAVRELSARDCAMMALEIANERRKE